MEHPMENGDAWTWHSHRNHRRVQHCGEQVGERVHVRASTAGTPQPNLASRRRFLMQTISTDRAEQGNSLMGADGVNRPQVIADGEDTPPS